MKDCLYKGINDYCTDGVTSEQDKKWEGENSNNSHDGSKYIPGSNLWTRGAHYAVTVTMDGRAPKSLKGMLNMFINRRY